jgi:hypothetical protein
VTVVWLESFDLTVPTRAEGNRSPTLSEIRTILDNLEGYEVDYLIGRYNWQATITHPTRPEWAALTVEDLSERSREDIPREFYFDRGWVELITEILEQLAEKCGPFVLVENSETPCIVLPKNVN